MSEDLYERCRKQKTDLEIQQWIRWLDTHPVQAWVIIIILNAQATWRALMYTVRQQWFWLGVICGIPVGVLLAGIAVFIKLS